MGIVEDMDIAHIFPILFSFYFIFQLISRRKYPTIPDNPGKFMRHPEYSRIFRKNREPEGTFQNLPYPLHSPHLALWKALEIGRSHQNGLEMDRSFSSIPEPSSIFHGHSLMLTKALQIMLSHALQKCI